MMIIIILHWITILHIFVTKWNNDPFGQKHDIQFKLTKTITDDQIPTLIASPAFLTANIPSVPPITHKNAEGIPKGENFSVLSEEMIRYEVWG